MMDVIINFVWKHYLIKVEYLEDGFADIKYFEASERLTYKPSTGK